MAQSEARQDAMPKLRTACGRASQKIVKLSKVSALKRMMGYTTNVKDAITHLAKTAEVGSGGLCLPRHRLALNSRHEGL